MNKIVPFFKLIRWPNLLLLALNLLIIKLFLIDESANISSVFTDYIFLKLTISILLITAAGYLINDYYDVEIDKINKPKKVIIGKFISKNVSIIIYFLFNLSAVYLVKNGHNWLIIIFIITIFLLWIYSYKIKGILLIGNLLVSILTALPLIIFAIYFEKNPIIIFIYVYFAFGISMIREIVKDLEDFDGDKKLNLKTAAIVWGKAKTVKYLSYFSIAFFTSFVVLLLSISMHYSVFVAFFLPIFFYFYMKLKHANSKTDFNFLSKILKIVMLFGVLSMIFVK